MRRPQVSDEHGAALLFTVALMLVATVAVQAVLAVVAHEARAGATFRDSIWAFYVSEAGLERAVFELGRDSDWADRKGATALLGTATSEAVLCLDPAAEGTCPEPAASVPFPDREPLGRFTVRLATHETSRCTGASCLCVWAAGQAGRAVRTVEAVLTRDGPEAPVRMVGWREVVERSRGPCRP